MKLKNWLAYNEYSVSGSTIPGRVERQSSFSCFSDVSKHSKSSAILQYCGNSYRACLNSAVDRMGKMVLAGGAVVGLGALCYYGLGMSSEIGAIEKAV